MRGLPCEISGLYDTDEWDDKDRADVGGERGGSGITMGSTFGPGLRPL